MRELNFISTGKLEWIERNDPKLITGDDAIVRPIVVGRCDGDTLPIHHRVSRAMQAGLTTGLIDPAVGSICGPVPFQGPFAIGHEAIAEVVETGPYVKGLRVGDNVVVPWSVSCGRCGMCRRGLTSKCSIARDGRAIAAYGFGPACGPYGGMVADLIRVPFAEHMLDPLPEGLDPLRVALPPGLGTTSSSRPPALQPESVKPSELLPPAGSARQLATTSGRTPEYL